jgi:hypothetical protein
MSKKATKKGDDSKKSSSKKSTDTKTATKTSTDAYTQGNITVTGGAGRGANTKVSVAVPRGSAKPAKKAKSK